MCGFFRFPLPAAGEGKFVDEILAEPVVSLGVIMPIFKLMKQKFSPVQELKVDLEKDLQRLVEENLDQIFGLKFVCSEFPSLCPSAMSAKRILGRRF